MDYNVKKFGARGDGVSNDGPSLQNALDACAVAGGGSVNVPAGLYRSGTLFLKSRTSLHLDAGAVIQGIDDVSLFPFIRDTPYGNLPGNIRALVVAEEASDISVRGAGTIDGGGTVAPSWEEAARMKFRPALVFIRDCRQVRFEGVSLLNTKFWTLHLMHCDDVFVRGVTIRANQQMPNSDGIDPDGCRNVIVSDCNITTCDDAICLKSTEGRPCENVVVTNCIVSSRCAALKLGTEAVGDIRNVLFSNCVVRASNVGLALYMKDGSTYENVLFSGVAVEADNPFPILLDITPRYYREPKKGRIRSVTLESVSITGPGRCLIEGLPDAPVEDVAIRNLRWLVTGACDAANSEKPAGARRIDPDPNRPRHCRNPYQFVVANASRVRIDGVSVAGADGAAIDRGLVCFTGVRDSTVRGLRGPALPAGLNPVSFTDSVGCNVDTAPLP